MTDTERVFNLLIKVTDCCDRIGVPYFLGFLPMRLALTSEELPAGIRSMEIFVYMAHVPKLCEALSKDEVLAVESLETNPNCADTCVKVVARNSTFLDLLNPDTTAVPAYSLCITPIVNAPINTKRAKKAFVKANYGVVQRNQLADKPLRGFHRMFRGAKKKYSGRVADNQVHLLRYRYRNYNFSKAYFSGSSRIDLNGHSFSTVRYINKFIKLYYKKPLENYPATTKLDTTRYVLQPELPYVKTHFRQTIIIRAYGKMMGFLNRFIRKDLTVVEKQRRFFFRTVDRFAMMDLYAPLKDQCMTAYNECDWETLGELLEPYIHMVEKYQKQKMTFAFDYEMYDCLMDFLYHTDEKSKMLNWLMAERPRAFKYLDYVNSYNPPSKRLAGK